MSCVTRGGSVDFCRHDTSVDDRDAEVCRCVVSDYRGSLYAGSIDLADVSSGGEWMKSRSVGTLAYNFLATSSDELINYSDMLGCCRSHDSTCVSCVMTAAASYDAVSSNSSGMIRESLVKGSKAHGGNHDPHCECKWTEEEVSV